MSGSKVLSCRRFLCLALFLMVFSFSGISFPDAAHAATGNTGRTLASRPLPNLGQSCFSCHGAKGEGLSSRATPEIAGLDARYIRHELDLFAEKKRSGVMQVVAKDLSARDRDQVARYFSGLKSFRKHPVFHPASSWGLGERLSREGRLSAGIPSCFTCHGPTGHGVSPSFPPITGLSPAYIGAQLSAFKGGFRSGDPDGVMSALSRKLSPADIGALSQWLAGGKDHPVVALAHHGVYANGKFTPPDWDGGPPGPNGDAIRYGRALFLHTRKLAPWFDRHGLNCAACHLGGGTLANAAPLWAAFVSYPVYRKKNHKVVTYGERLQDCFRFSLNGKSPALSSKEIVSLEAYSKWMSDGAPVGATLYGRGFPALTPPPHPVSLKDGRMVYRHSCALCHGVNGQGLMVGDRMIFPPLWGSHSFNCGAGLHLVAKAASFIQRNMPLGNPGTLSVQQAWDVARYLESRPHPPDPRKSSVSRN
jgi:thiosulfate dehydrogenase